MQLGRFVTQAQSRGFYLFCHFEQRKGI